MEWNIPVSGHKLFFSNVNNLHELKFSQDPQQCLPLQTVEWTCYIVFLGLRIDMSHAESALLTRAPPRQLVALEHVINSLPFFQLKLFLQELLLPWRSAISVFIRMCHHRNKGSPVSWICHYRSRVFLSICSFSWIILCCPNSIAQEGYIGSKVEKYPSFVDWLMQTCSPFSCPCEFILTAWPEHSEWTWIQVHP